MERTTSCSPVCIVNLFIKGATRNEKVKGLFEGFLGVMEYGVESIPAGGS